MRASCGAWSKNRRRLPFLRGALIEKRGEATPAAGLTYADLLRRGIGIHELCAAYGILADLPEDILLRCETEIRYEGYLKRGRAEAEHAKRMEACPLPADLDYAAISGLRLEAREKLARVRPLDLGQAGRISGVSPADIAVLMVYLQSRTH